MKNSSFSRLFGKPLFWILLFFAIRLVGITNPPLEVAHHWRQVTGLMVARNFLETDANILYPRVDDNHGNSGIVALEFPLLNYLHYLVSAVFDYTHWYGRLVSLIVSSFGMFFFYKLLERYFLKKIAFTALLLLMGSIWFSFSRKMMPDVFSLSLVIIGLYYLSNYLSQGKWHHLLWYFIFASFGVLSKIPAVIYFACIPLLFLAHKNLKRMLLSSLVSILIISLLYAWYFEWNPFLAEEYGQWYNTGSPLFSGAREILSNIRPTMEQFWFHSFQGFILPIVSLAGLIFAIKHRRWDIIMLTLSLGLVFLAYMFKSGIIFPFHTYYIIPFVPVMALTAAYVLSLIKQPWIYIVILFLGIGESILNQQHDFFIKDSELYKMDLEEIADKLSDPADLIAISGEGSNAQQLYLAHRKGWVLSASKISDSHYHEDLIQAGCKYLFVNLHEHTSLPHLDEIYRDENYAVYSLGAD